jgi:hypothetical protein
LHHSRHVAIAAGTLAVTETRQIETKSDKQAFGFDFNQIAPLVSRGKEISIASLLALSRRQARLFIDTLIEFDGTTVKATGVRRFFSSRPALMAAFEIGAVAAGYSVSYRRERVSDLSDRTNFSVSISGRSEIGVRRWGRPYHNLEVEKGRRPASLELTRNESGKVWCVTVPSGLIVVRRRGFSMVCGNCAESDALRSSFPTMLGPLGVPDQMTPLSQFDPAASQMPCLDTRKQTQAPEQIETADQSPRPSEGDASEIPDDEASQRMAMEIQDAIDGAANGEEHAAVRVKLDAAQDTLGDATYIALVRMWRAKGKEIGVK